LLPLRLLASRNVSGANLVQALMVAGMYGMFFLGSLYLQRVLGYDALHIGLAFLPVALAIGALSIDTSARLIARVGARVVLVAGLALILPGLIWFARVPVDGRYLTDLLPSMLLLGIGGGLSFPALMSLAMSDATAEDAGLVSGLVSTTAQVGGALGLAVLATLSSSRADHLLGAGESPAAALTAGYHLAFGVGAVLVLIALVLAAAVLRRPAAADPTTRERVPAAAEADACDCWAA
jgi:MFS family permease